MISRLVFGDCLDAMRAMAENSVDAVVTDPPYGLEFMGKEWDRLWDASGDQQRSEGYVGSDGGARKKTRPISANFDSVRYEAGAEAQAWHLAWAKEALRVVKPGGHLVAFGGTRTLFSAIARMASRTSCNGCTVRGSRRAWT